MKTKVFYVFAVALFVSLMPLQSSAQWWKQIVPQVQVSSDVLRQLGITGQNMTITNGTPFWCRIVVYGKEVARLSPGSTAYDDRRWETLSPQLPIASLCYKDEALTNYLGAGARIFSLSSSYSNSVSWTIRGSDIQTPDNRYVQTERGARIYPSQNTKATTERVKFPREWWNATSGMQVVNNTYFSVEVRLNGKSMGRINQGEFYYLSVRSFDQRQPQRMTVLFVFTNNGTFEGTAERSLRVATQGVVVGQHVLSANDIRQ